MPSLSQRRRVIVASGDYKAVDPAAVTLDVEEADSLRLGVDVTSLSGAGCTVTVTVNGIDAVNGTEYLLLQKAITTQTFNPLVIDPRVPAAANAVAQTPLPARVIVRCVGSGTRTTLTYGVSAESQGN